VKTRRLLGAALTVSVLVGGLVLVNAGPAAACSCMQVRSETERAARADAIFVGTLVGRRVDPLAWAGVAMTRPGPAPVVFTFEVSRVYKGAVSERQEIVTPGGGEVGCGGFGFRLRGPGPFLVFADQSSNANYQLGLGQYGASLCSGSRALAEGEPALGGLAARAPSWPSAAGLVVGAKVLAVVVVAGVAIVRGRRRARAD
jgi:hypothetical protein